MLPATALVKADWVLKNPTPTNDPEIIVRRMLTNYVGEFKNHFSEEFINSFCQPYLI